MFECGIIHHYASKFPYEKMNDSDDESSFKQKYQKKNQTSKKNKFFSKEKSDNEINESVNDEERSENLFIADIEEPKEKFNYEG